MLFHSPEFTPATARERVAAPLLRAALRFAIRPVLSPHIPIPWQRRWLRVLTRSGRPSRRVDVEPGASGGVSGEWIRPRPPSASANSRAAILYLHGGGYCLGSPATHRAVTSRLARATGLLVFAADYRLAPEHPFPAAVEDAVAAYRSLIDNGPVIVAGESAGGGLSLATALVARERQIGQAAALVLFSPWVDLKPTALSPHKRADVMLSARWLDACARHYLAGHDAASPLASPIHADLRGLPPTLIQAGSEDILYGDAVRIHDALSDAGVPVVCEIVAKRWHAIQLHAGMLPSANAAIERASHFISRHIAS
jgi:acetyl esterase/lipase